MFDVEDRVQDYFRPQFYRKSKLLENENFDVCEVFDPKFLKENTVFGS